MRRVFMGFELKYFTYFLGHCHVLQPRMATDFWRHGSNSACLQPKLPRKTVPARQILMIINKVGALNYHLFTVRFCIFLIIQQDIHAVARVALFLRLSCVNSFHRQENDEKQRRNHTNYCGHQENDSPTFSRLTLQK